MNKLLSLFAMLLFSSTFMQVNAQPLAPPAYVAGEHYEVLSSPLKLAGDDKIEVMEVFWYGCGHCQKFEPIVRGWKKTLAEDVTFMRTPAVWGKKDTPSWKIMNAHARLYYAVDALNLPEQVHDQLFAAIVSNRELSTASDFGPIVSKFGASAESFKAKFDSFTMSTLANKGAKRMAKHYNSGGTPELIVNGRYRISAKMSGSLPGMIDVANFLVEQERKRLN